MFFSLIMSMFGWMPFQLRGLVAAVFVFFSVFVAIALIKTLLTLIEFIVGMLGGVLGKVASLFM